MEAMTSDGPPISVVPVSMAATLEEPRLMVLPCMVMLSIGISQYSDAEGRSM